MAPPQCVGPSDPLTQMNKYRSYVTILADSNAKDEIKVKAAQELSENFEASREGFPFGTDFEGCCRFFPCYLC
jgi:transformation/transcription domain-associated protein